MRIAHEQLDLKLEPSGAIALAALLEGKADAAGKCVVVVASGGNVDAEMFARALAAAL
jgi:threonine dehydratase